MSEMVNIVIDLEDQVLLKLALMAHERDITLNAFIIEILEEEVKKAEKSVNVV